MQKTRDTRSAPGALGAARLCNARITSNVRVGSAAGCVCDVRSESRHLEMHRAASVEQPPGKTGRARL